MNIIWIVIIFHKQCNFIFIIIPIVAIIPELPLSFFSFAARDANIKFIKSIRDYELNHIPRACFSDFFPLRYSCRAHAAADHRHHGKWIVSPSFLVAPSSGVHLSTHGCVHLKRRRDLSAAAYVTRRPHLGPLGVNKPPRFDIACHEIPFVWLSRERMRVSLICARVSAWKHACVYHPRSLILRIAAACWRRLESRIELSDNLECKI